MVQGQVLKSTKLEYNLELPIFGLFPLISEVGGQGYLVLLV